MTLTHKQRRMRAARTIHARSGDEALLAHLAAISYGDGDKFCSRALVDIAAAARGGQTDRLWALVSRFIDHWDLSWR